MSHLDEFNKFKSNVLPTLSMRQLREFMLIGQILKRRSERYFQPARHEEDFYTYLAHQIWLLSMELSALGGSHTTRSWVAVLLGPEVEDVFLKEDRHEL